MSKFTAIASLAVVAMGFSAISGGAAFAAGLPSSSLPALSLTQDAMVPNEGSAYQAAYDAQATQGNGRASATQVQYTSDWQDSRSNEARHSHG